MLKRLWRNAYPQFEVGCNLVRATNGNRMEVPLKGKHWDFPGGTVVKNPPANAGDTGSSPGPEGSHMPRSGWARVPQLLSLRSGAREPQLLSPRATTTEACTPQQEATAMRRPRTATKSSPCSLQLEEACAKQQRPNAAKNK